MVHVSMPQTLFKGRLANATHSSRTKRKYLFQEAFFVHTFRHAYAIPLTPPTFL